LKNCGIEETRFGTMPFLGESNIGDRDYRSNTQGGTILPIRRLGYPLKGRVSEGDPFAKLYDEFVGLVTPCNP